MNEVTPIIRKRNGYLIQDGDEIEIRNKTLKTFKICYKSKKKGSKWKMKD